MRTFKLFFISMAAFLISFPCVAEDLHPPVAGASTQEWTKYLNGFIDAFNLAISRQQQRLRGRAAPSILVTVRLNTTSQVPMTITSTDGKSLQFNMTESFMKELGDFYVESFFQLMNHQIDGKKISLNPSDLNVIAYDASQGDHRARALLTEFQIQILEAKEGVLEQPNLARWLKMKRFLQTQLQEQMREASLQYEQNLKAYQRRVPQINDDKLRELMWKLMMASDRSGLAKFFNSYLPWEVMSPSDKIIWKMWITNLTDTNPENKVLMYRGESGEYVEEKPPTLSSAANLLNGDGPKKLRMAWPLRKFISGEASFYDLFGTKPPGGLEKFSKDLLEGSFLHNILIRLRIHSEGKADQKTSASPFISTSPLVAGTTRFAMGEKFQGGYVRAYAVSALRLNQAQKAFQSESEILASLFLLPDEEVGKNAASQNIAHIDAEFEKLSEKLLQEKAISFEKRFFLEHDAQNLKNWLSDAAAKSAATSAGAVSCKMVFAH